jgi:beta-catenin-like protein 1
MSPASAAAVGSLQVAADPNTLYPLLIDSPAVPTLAGLLSHDNTDIAVEVMDLLQELTDAGGALGS